MLAVVAHPPDVRHEKDREHGGEQTRAVSQRLLPEAGEPPTTDGTDDGLRNDESDIWKARARQHRQRYQVADTWSLLRSRAKLIPVKRRRLKAVAGGDLVSDTTSAPMSWCRRRIGSRGHRGGVKIAKVLVNCAGTGHESDKR